MTKNPKPSKVKKMKTRYLFLLALWLVIFSFCKKAPHLKPGYVPPEEIIDRYHSALRWKEYEEAKQYVLPECRAEFDQFVKRMKRKLNIVDYEILEVKLEQDGWVAKSKVKRTYFLMPSIEQKEEVLNQIWKLVKGSWYLSSPPF